MNIEAATKVYGIFGHPVSHSLSPKMHNAAFRIQGVNVTIPHKENIIFFLDEISEEASLTGAVNTVKNEDGKLKGYNTDVGGFLKAIKEDLGFHPREMQAAVLGAGGAARAVVTALCMNEASGIYVINRTFDKAKKLVNEFKRNFKDISIEAVPLDDKRGVKDSLNHADILVNSTSAGMKGIDPI